MTYPPIVGLRCASCNKFISSKTEGRFCSSCSNPVHLSCSPPWSTDLFKGQCPECGSDCQSPLAMELQAEIQYSAAIAAELKAAKVICPNCGSKEGFETNRMDLEPNRLVFGGTFYSLIAILSAAEDAELLKCIKCRHIFRPLRPRNRVREIGCIILLVLGLGAIVALMVIRATR
jgi:rubredoxin